MSSGPNPPYANKEDVVFNNEVSDNLAKACRKVAQNINNAMPGLKSSLTTALEDFEGHYAEVTASNIDTAVSDGRDIANIFCQLASVVDQLKEAAHKEQENRRKAREYENEWFGLHKAWDDFWGNAPAKVEPYIPDTTIETR